MHILPILQCPSLLLAETVICKVLLCLHVGGCFGLLAHIEVLACIARPLGHRADHQAENNRKATQCNLLLAENTVFRQSAAQTIENENDSILLVP